MGVSLVARVEGLGVDAFQLIADQLQRDHQASPKERWICVMRSFRQPIPPLETASHDPNSSKKQRAMYCFRHSARPREFMAMIEDANAPNRPFPQAITSDCSANNVMTSENLEPVPTSETLEPSKETSLDNTHAVENQQLDQPSPNSGSLADATHRGSATMEGNSHIITQSSVVDAPSHYRISIISVPESFEPLLTSSICAPQANLIPSAWCPRPNFVAVDGMVWAVHNSSFELETASSNVGPMTTELSGRELQPDWWVRLGTVTNKGATSGNTCLPWLILEIECAASPGEYDHSSAFLESVMRVLIKPNKRLVVRPYRPTHQSLVEAGLMNQTATKMLTLRNSYCMLMLAKEEGLI